MSTKEKRILGALLGVHAGDSFGAAHEFETWQAIRARFPPNGAIPRAVTGGGPFGWSPGHATDDTDMTRAVLLAYKDCHSMGADSLSVARVASKHMLQWFYGPWVDRPAGSWPADIGGATTSGLSLLAKTIENSGQVDPRKAGAGHGSCGNGSLMRCIPTALFSEGGDQQRLVEETTLISAVTHNDWRCILACIAYNAMVRALAVDAATPAAAVEAGLEAVTDPQTANSILSILTVDGQRPGQMSTLRDAKDEVVAAIEKARLPGFRVAVLAEEGPHVKIEGDDGAEVEALPLEGRGFVLDSLILAIAAVLDTTRSWEDLIVDVVRVGRDTDTNGAVAGGLVGARDGIDAIPESWLSTLQFREEFTSIANQLMGSEK
ncbi:hypothetical protein SEUCBS140593_008911 [Sporothrix eucalyptigena]|uniref:ADP-ribosylhydrolase ARH3 n=1 Tax=Sporothrix eucalyptigena TaxID=1812306 RepID=A0ABP0CS26_9PEZI